MQQGTINVSDTGGIVAALLLFAADAVQFSRSFAELRRPMEFSEFIKYLLGREMSEKLLFARSASYHL
jgi:hypothetical protein